MKPLHPPLTIYFLPSGKWNCVKNGLSFEIIQQKFDDGFRRLIKGANRRQEQDRLFNWFDQLKIFTPGMIKKNDVIPMDLEPEMISQWFQLLSALAEAQSKEAVLSGGPDGTPPFLSCIWAPPQPESLHAQPYQSTVNSHLSFLEKMSQINQFNQTLLNMLSHRKKIFNRANEKMMGVVEHVGDLY